VSLLQRKQVALRQKLAGLDAEFAYWLAQSSSNASFEKHWSQVRALTGHLSGLLDQTHSLLDESVREGTILTEGRNIESLVLGLRRIWEFFRSKFSQRMDGDMCAFLRAADELAWACYKPMLDIRKDIVRRQPPLVFLNGGLSPYALSRGQAFPAEDVPGEKLTGRTYDTVLSRLPIPLIGVPWYQVRHLPDLPVVAHEVGHAIEQDFGLTPLMLNNLESELKQDPVHLAHWVGWSHEVFADLWGCLLLGPAYASSLMDFLAGDLQQIVEERAGANDPYPTAYLRILLCANALGRLGFGAEDDALKAIWSSQYSRHAMPEFEKDVGPVVEALLGKLRPVADPACQSLLDTSALRFTVGDYEAARMGADLVRRNRYPNDEATTTIRRWAAAARLLYDTDSAVYASCQHGQSFMACVEKLIEPGTRGFRDTRCKLTAEATAVESHERKQLDPADIESGRQLFAEFTTWAGR
jgi:hypothetical protein